MSEEEPVLEVNHARDKEMNNEETGDTYLFDVLPWDDILYRHIFTYLRIKDLFHLRVSQSALACIDEYFTKCRIVNLSYYQHRFDDNAFRLVCHSNRALRTLSLKGHKNWLDDAVFMPMFDVCRSLCRLDLAGCSSLSPKSIVKLTANSPNLCHLRLTECYWVSKECIMAISTNCTKLQSLDLEACWGLTEDALIMLLMNCTQLEVLSMAKIYSVTDGIVMQAADCLTGIKKLSVFNCWRVTNTAIRHLGEYAKHLEKLETRNCPEVTEASLARLRLKGIKIDVILHPSRRNPKTRSTMKSLQLQPT